MFDECRNLHNFISRVSIIWEGNKLSNIFICKFQICLALKPSYWQDRIFRQNLHLMSLKSNTAQQQCPIFSTSNLQQKCSCVKLSGIFSLWIIFSRMISQCLQRIKVSENNSLLNVLVINFVRWHLLGGWVYSIYKHKQINIMANKTK